MIDRLSCRVATYGPHQGLAFEHVAGLGLRFVEIRVPAADQVSAVRRELERFGLRAATLHAAFEIARDDLPRQVESQLPAFAELGCSLMFVSVKCGELPRAIVYDRLRRAAEQIAPRGLTLLVETHPELATNAVVALETIQAVNHPNVRLNFDTANIHFYNQGLSEVDELRKVASVVAAVHLKDTDGGYRHWHFPALGRGVVDFRGIFGVLDAAGFAGPLTLEIEGIEGEQKTERLVCDRIAESVGYLRGLGRRW